MISLTIYLVLFGPFLILLEKMKAFIVLTNQNLQLFEPIIFLLFFVNLIIGLFLFINLIATFFYS